MDPQSKTPWPTTYLGRLQAVTTELQDIGSPTTASVVLERFSGVTVEQVESVLAALVLCGRAEKKGDRFLMVNGS
jgi:hypothetical protein